VVLTTTVVFFTATGALAVQVPDFIGQVVAVWAAGFLQQVEEQDANTKDAKQREMTSSFIVAPL